MYDINNTLTVIQPQLSSSSLDERVSFVILVVAGPSANICFDNGVLNTSDW